MSAVFEGFGSHDVDVGETRIRAAVGGDGPVDCGHFLPAEAPESTLAALGEFLAG